MAETKIRSQDILDATVTDTDIAAANKDGLATLASLRTLGTGATQAAAGNDSRFLPTDTVIVAGTRILANKLVGTDTQPAFRLFGDGKLEWGPGGTTAVDTNLYRVAAGRLRTDGILDAGGRTWITPTGAGGDIIFQGDTNLYRAATNDLRTDGMLQAAGSLVASTAGAGHVYIRNNTGRVYFGLADDASLYRLSGNALATAGEFSAREGNAARVGIGNVIGGGQPGIVFGSAADTNLYRDTTSSLYTAGLFKVNGSGAGVGSSTAAGLLLNWPTIGTRWLEMGPADSAGAGYRSVRIAN